MLFSLSIWPFVFEIKHSKKLCFMFQKEYKDNQNFVVNSIFLLFIIEIKKLSCLTIRLIRICI